MWREVANYLSDSLLLINEDNRIFFANTAACALMGRHKILGEDVSSFQRTPELLESLSAVRTQGVARKVRYRVLTPIRRHFEAHICPLGHNLLLLVRETTQTRRAEMLRTEFAAQASHALKTPLTILLGAIETLKVEFCETESPKNLGVFFTMIETQGHRMQRIVEGLLSLGRIELLEHIPPSTPVDLVALIKEVFWEMQGRAQEAGVRVTVHARATPPVLGYKEELVQVFQNLLDNAFIHAAQGKKVDVFIQKTPHHTVSQEIERGVQVVVQDYGTGIDKKHLPRLTERFYRVEKAKGKVPGAGLGLAIVKHIINNHRGTLHISSTPKGSRFVVILPSSLAQ